MSPPDPHVVHVRARSGDYPVLVGRGLLDELPDLLRAHAPAYRYALISDSNVAPLYGAPAAERCRAVGLDAHLFEFPAGEASKTRKQWSILTDALVEAGIGRDGVVVAVGGGVTGDLAGFVAATLLRGIPVVQVPTSLVAMIDASVGGKTAVDVRAGKNLVGAFHPPSVVVADPDTVATLPRRERAQGLVEAVKHGAVMDGDHLDELVEAAEALMDGEPGATARAVARSVELKATIVSEDEREEGKRQILNFGHTLGHALEAASGFAIGHGSAVAAGMLLEAELGHRAGVTGSEVRGRLHDALRALGLGTVPTVEATAARMEALLGADKKTRGGRPRFVLLERVGRVHAAGGWSHEVDPGLVSDVLREALI